MNILKRVLFKMLIIFISAVVFLLAFLNYYFKNYSTVHLNNILMTNLKAQEKNGDLYSILTNFTDQRINNFIHGSIHLKNRKEDGVIVLGDSIAAGYRILKQEQSFPSFLEKIVKEFNPNKIFYNCSIGGLNTEAEINFYEKFFFPVPHSLILVQLSINDWEYLDPEPIIWKGFISFKSYSQEIFFNKYLLPFNFLLGNYFFIDTLYVAIDKSLVKFGIGMLNEKTEPYFERFKRALLKLKKLTKNPVVLVFFPRLSMPPQLNDIPVKSVKTEAKNLGFYFLDLTPVFFRQDINSLKAFEGDTCHPNIKGNKLVAEEIYRFLKQKRLLNLKP